MDFMTFYCLKIFFFSFFSPSDNSINYGRLRTCFTQKQLTLLEEEYAKEEYLSKTRRKMISHFLQLPENTIKVSMYPFSEITQS